MESVTIIIPTFNRIGLLPQAIESVLAQDYPAKYIIVVDDGSSDGTADVCAEYASRVPYFSYLYKENGGCSSARNFGLEHIQESSGFIVFLDSDDLLLPGMIARMVSQLISYPDAGYCYSDSIVSDEVMNVEYLQRAAAAGRPMDFPLEHFLTHEAKPASILYRAEILRSMRFREDLFFNEDSEFLQRVALENKATYCDAPSSWVRWHSGSKSRNSLNIQLAVFQSSKDILEKYPEFYGRHKNVLDRKLQKIQKNLFCELVMAGMTQPAAAFAMTAWQKISLNAGKPIQAIYLTPFRLKALLRQAWIRWFC